MDIRTVSKQRECQNLARRMLLFAALSGVTIACTTVADGQNFNFNERIREKVIKGRTTTADVLILIGEPYSIEKEDDTEVWRYFVIEKRRGDYLTRRLMISFNPDGTVDDLDYMAKSKRIYR